MNLGPLNRRARLWANTPTRGLGGAVSDSLTHLKWLPVTLGEVGQDNTEKVAAARDATMQAGVFTTRWLATVANNQFLDFEGVRYRIHRYRILGRREGMVLYGEQVK